MKKSILKKVMALSMAATMLCLTACGNTGAQSEAPVESAEKTSDTSRFDDVKEIQKLSGMGLVSCSSGKHKGQTKISHRGRKRLRYWLF